MRNINKKSKNKNYVHVKDLLKGRRNIDISKLIEDKDFMTSLKKDVYAYNERLRYTAKKEGKKEVSGKLYVSDIKKQIKSGKVDIQSFKKGFMSDLYSNYREVRKPKKESLKKVSKPRIKREDTVLDENWRELNKKMREIYGTEIARRNVSVLRELKQNLKRIEKSGIQGVNTDFYKEVENAGYKLNALERKNILVKNILETGDYHSGLVKSFNDAAEIGNKLREEKLDESIKKYYDYDKDYVEALKTLSYEDKVAIYNSDIKPRYLENKEEWASPIVTKKRKELSEIDAATLTEEAAIKAISDIDLKSSVYIDNFLRSLNTLEQDEGQKLTKRNKDAILRLIRYIPKDRLSTILLKDEIKIERWYKTEDSFFNLDDRMQYVFEQLQDLVIKDALNWGLSVSDREDTIKDIRKITYSKVK